VNYMSSKIALGRLGEPEDLKGLIVFIASDASEYISGHVFEIAGGPIETAAPIGVGMKYLKWLEMPWSQLLLETYLVGLRLRASEAI